MPYVLGVDVGTCRTAAAVAWSGGEVELVRLGASASTVPTVLYLAPDGSVVLGASPAVHDTLAGDGRAARGFVRRIGDEVPLAVGGELCTPEALAATTVMWVVDLATADAGAPPEHIAVTHPASWGPHRTGLLLDAVREIGLRNVTLLPEPLAAAVCYAAGGRIDIGDVVAVYNLGAERFEAAVVRRTGPVAFDLLGCAESTDQMGGGVLDDLLSDHVRGCVGRALADLDPADPQVRLAMSWLRDECVRAKEQLSTAGETAVLVQLPHTHTEVRVTRDEFEELVRPELAATVDTLARTVRSCGIHPGELTSTLLVGGSARIPLAADLVAAELGGSVAVDAEPELTVARGAALAAHNLLRAARPSRAGPAGPRFVPRPPPPSGGQTARPAGAATGQRSSVARRFEDAGPPPRPPVETTPMYLPERRSRRVPELKPVVLAAALALVIAVGVLLTVAGSALG